jgi:hypothetical protein
MFIGSASLAGALSSPWVWVLRVEVIPVRTTSTSRSIAVVDESPAAARA